MLGSFNNITEQISFVSLQCHDAELLLCLVDPGKDCLMFKAYVFARSGHSSSVPMLQVTRITTPGHYSTQQVSWLTALTLFHPQEAASVTQIGLQKQCTYVHACFALCTNHNITSLKELFDSCLQVS